LTLWSFIGQVLQDGKQSSCNAAVTNATRYMLEHGMQPPGPVFLCTGPNPAQKSTKCASWSEAEVPHQIGLCPRRFNNPSFGAGPQKIRISPSSRPFLSVSFTNQANLIGLVDEGKALPQSSFCKQTLPSTPKLTEYL